MRVFLCGFGGFSVAIPMQSVSSLALNTENVSPSGAAKDNPAFYNNDENNLFISLPRLFNVPMENIMHRIMLKGLHGEDSAGNDSNDSIENKIILLIPEVICETDIPEDKIFPVPGTLSRTRFSAIFDGIQITDKPVLLLNPEQLIENVKNVKKEIPL